jgi:hypothetical protein
MPKAMESLTIAQHYIMPLVGEVVIDLEFINSR